MKLIATNQNNQYLINNLFLDLLIIVNFLSNQKW